MTKIFESEVKNIATSNNKISLDGFDGIDSLKCHTSFSEAEDIINFRIRSDGSLEKREGYRLLCSFEEKVRAVWTGDIGAQFYCYALAGNGVYRVDVSDGSATLLGNVATTQAYTDFFYYRGGLYLLDGQKLYAVSDNGLSEPFGYVPLIGKEWSDGERGELFEPRNLLNNKGRITYIISSTASSVLYLDEEISSIDAVFVNGSAVSSDRYSKSSLGPLITVSGLATGDKVSVYFTYASVPYSAEELMRNRRAVVFGGINTSRLFLFGGTDGSVMYSSAYVSESALASSRLCYSDSDALYFPYGYEFTVGDGRYPISAVCRHYDRLLIFTEGGAWMADSSACGTEEFPVMNINSSVGVSSERGEAMLENFPCTVGVDGIYRWTADTDELNDCNAYRISGAIDSRLSRDFLKNACVYADKSRGELLFSCPDADSRVWVYSEMTSKWTSFDGIDAEYFFDVDGCVGFVRDNGIYVLDGGIYTDCGKEISACFTSGVSNFGTDYAKHLCYAGLCFDGEGADIELYLDSEDEPSVSVSFITSDTHTAVRKRISSKRFSHLKVRLVAGAGDRQVIHSLYLTAR